MKRTVIRLMAVMTLGLGATGCIGITKGNPLALVPASELALIRSSAPVEKEAISVDDLLAQARATGKDAGPAAAPVPMQLDLAFEGEAVVAGPGHLASVGSFVAAAPAGKITIACGSGLDAEGLRAHRRALTVRKLLEFVGAAAEIRREPGLAPGTIRLIRGGRQA
ncbi:MAG: hypothetical protein ACMVY4_10750 [Minwuia sp.]|uniref:hypothetical protein n=1 Tax=Minwuia sp. TaxID=2493630 RepID=UPI003A88B781